MGRRDFWAMIRAQWERGNFVCVGLDSAFDKIPEAAHQSGSECDIDTANTIVAFNRAIVEATQEFACAFKPNIAFYEAYGDEGINALHRTIVDIRTIAPDVPVILDAKRADIGNTNGGYVEMVFRFLLADAVTVNPYFGGEALKPFLEWADKGIFVLCRTSNPEAGEFQNLVAPANWGTPVPTCRSAFSENVAVAPIYAHVAHRVVTHWNGNRNCGLVVGATRPEELQEVRKIVGDMPILIPGIGAQGGDVEQTVSAGKDSHGQGMIINSSRGIIFASDGADFAKAARRETEKLHDLINRHRLVSPVA